MKKIVFLIFTLILNNSVFADHTSRIVDPLTPEKSEKLQALYATSVLVPVGGTVSVHTSMDSETVENYTIVCLEMVNSDCSKYGLVSETNIDNKHQSKSYELHLIPSNPEAFYKEQAEFFKDRKTYDVNNTYLSYYVIGIFVGFGIGYEVGGATGGATALVSMFVGGLIDIVKSPFVAIAHGVNYAYTRVVSGSDAQDMFSFITDRSKAGQLLHVNAKTTYSKQVGNAPMHVGLVQSGDTLQNQALKSVLNSTEVYEVDNKFFTPSEYYKYIYPRP